MWRRVSCEVREGIFSDPPLCLSAEQCDLSKIIRKDRKVLASGKSQGGDTVGCSSSYGIHLLTHLTAQRVEDTGIGFF